jgi:hypothetical protein
MNAHATDVSVPPVQVSRSAFRKPSSVAYLLIAIVLALSCLVRLHLRQIPLERDEGEYAYAGQLLLQGIAPYKLAYNMKLPGTYVAYALIVAAFGQSPAGVRMGLMFANAATILLVFFLGLRLAGRTAGVVAGASYAVLSVSPSVLGFCGHASHFVMLMAVPGILLLHKSVQDKRPQLLFLSGALLGLAFVMKQPGILFVVFGAIYLLRNDAKAELNARTMAQRLAFFSAGATLQFVITCLWLWRAGVFRTFWFWAFSYASQYATNWSLGEGAHLLITVLPAVIGPSVGIWALAGLGLSAFFWKKEIRRHAEFALGFLLFSFLAVCPGLIFREHYFILMLPAVSVLAGIGVSAATQALSSHATRTPLPYAAIAACLLGLASPFYWQRNFFLEHDPIAACRSIYGGNPFPEAIPIADYIRQRSPEGSRIAVLGSEPEIFFYAHRHSATGYIYAYGLMEEQKYALRMQQQMISEIEAAHPEFLVWVSVRASWLPQDHSEGLILSWAHTYVQENYDLAGIADIHLKQTDYRWGDDAKKYQPSSNSVVFVFKRKSS